MFILSLLFYTASTSAKQPLSPLSRSNSCGNTCCDKMAAQKESPQETTLTASDLFPDIWNDATSDIRLTMFGFRRFRTTQLINLRYLEKELEKVDRAIYQAGLQLPQHVPELDRLGLKHAQRDVTTQPMEATINEDLIIRLRSLTKEYSNVELFLDGWLETDWIRRSSAGF